MYGGIYRQSDMIEAKRVIFLIFINLESTMHMQVDNWAPLHLVNGSYGAIGLAKI